MTPQQIVEKLLEALASGIPLGPVGQGFLNFGLSMLERALGGNELTEDELKEFQLKAMEAYYERQARWGLGQR